MSNNLKRYKTLVTGANGFVARYLISELRKKGDVIVGVDKAERSAYGVDAYYACDLMNRQDIEDVLVHERPDRIVHLAAISSVGQSWKMPVDAFLNNTNIFLNVVDSVRKIGLKTRILSVGSSEEYGNVSELDIPLREDYPLNPCSPYAVARVSQEQLSLLYAKGYGLDIVLTRSFNQFGPGQNEKFVIPSFVAQLREGKAAGQTDVSLRTGDLTIVRDFLDVRDAVSAYLIILDRGASGTIYNVCSGKGHSLREVLDTIAQVIGVRACPIVDQTLIRPADNRIIVGDNGKLKSELGWTLKYSMIDTLKEMAEN